MAHEPGDVIAGRYRLDDRIATGGMGEVWRGTDTVLHRPVAIKTLRADRATDPQFQVRFRHEARAMAALHHPGIADVYDYGDDGEAYLVMARVDGQPLDERIAERGRLDSAETLAVVAQVGRALQAVHDAGIVHRDVKPGNLIVRPDRTVVLVDFGIARSAQSPALTGAREVVGTAHYIAPEQVARRPVGPPADLYALGAVAYHCLAGHPPFPGDDPLAVAMQHLRDVPPPLPAEVTPRARALVATALAKDPADRFPSAAAMAAAAEDTATTVPFPAPPRTVHVPQPTAPASRHRPVLLSVLAALFVLLIAGGVLAVADPFGWFPATPQPSASTSAPATPRTRQPTRTRSSATATREPSETPGSTPATSPSSSAGRSPSQSPSDRPSPSPSTPSPSG